MFPRPAPRAPRPAPRAPRPAPSERQVPADQHSRIRRAEQQLAAAITVVARTRISMQTLARALRDFFAHGIAEQRAEHGVGGPVPPVDETSDTHTGRDRVRGDRYVRVREPVAEKRRARRHVRDMSGWHRVLAPRVAPRKVELVLISLLAACLHVISAEAGGPQSTDEPIHHLCSHDALRCVRSDAAPNAIANASILRRDADDVDTKRGWGDGRASEGAT